MSSVRRTVAFIAISVVVSACGQRALKIAGKGTASDFQPTSLPSPLSCELVLVSRQQSSARVEVRAQRYGEPTGDYQVQSVIPNEIITVVTASPPVFDVAAPTAPVQVVAIVAANIDGENKVAQCGAVVAGSNTPGGTNIGGTPPPLAPVINSFTLNGGNPNVANGATITAEWQTNNTTACVLHQPITSGGINVPVNGSTPVGPLVNPGAQPLTLNFKLACTGPGGATESPVLNIVVAPPPPPVIVSFTVNAGQNPNVASGASVAVQWEATNASGCTILQPELGNVDVQPMGNRTMGPLVNPGPNPRNYGFVLGCAGPGGTVESTIRTITVAPACTPAEQRVLDEFPHSQAVIAQVRTMFTVDQGTDVFRNDAPTAEKICLAYGFPRVKLRDGRHRDGRYNYTSPGDNYHLKWNGTLFDRVAAYNGQWLSTLVCERTCQ